MVQRGVSEFRAAQRGLLQIRRVEDGPDQPSVIQNGAEQVCLLEIGTVQVGTREIRLPQVSLSARPAVALDPAEMLRDPVLKVCRIEPSSLARRLVAHDGNAPASTLSAFWMRWITRDARKLLSEIAHDTTRTAMLRQSLREP